ncbi:hypothetical protein VNO80_30049 [Phaseolus coccineus]|uniref:Uncharacterized protein n=1 Tax=Phaseolus coccineus TaxID=3886 RepID=A0AAN9LCH5_PHACN
MRYPVNSLNRGGFLGDVDPVHTDLVYVSSPTTPPSESFTDLMADVMHAQLAQCVGAGVGRLGIKDEIHTPKDQHPRLSRWSREEIHGLGARWIGVIDSDAATILHNFMHICGINDADQLLNCGRHWSLILEQLMQM